MQTNILKKSKNKKHFNLPPLAALKEQQPWGYLSFSNEFYLRYIYFHSPLALENGRSIKAV